MKHFLTLVLSSIFLTIFLNPIKVFCQSSAFICESESSLSYASSLSSDCGDACYATMSTSDMTSLPIINIAVQFHFIQTSSSTYQFQCTNPSASYYAADYAQSIIDQANIAFSNPAANAFGSSPDIPDARIRYYLYGNPVDPCDAIFFNASVGSLGTVTPNALHIIINNNIPSSMTCASGGQANMGSSQMILNGPYCRVFIDGWTDLAAFGPIMNHEFGHILGLCHAHSIQNVCPDMDPVAECGGSISSVCNSTDPTPCSTINPSNLAYDPNCGNNPCFDCYCTWGNGNNFMGYNGQQDGMTMSQWAKMYGSLINTTPGYASIEYPTCTPVSPTPASLDINTGTTVVWNNLRIINQPIEIHAGSTLKITCEVRMNYQMPIIVHRGGRLWVHGGLITSQEPDCRWGGILVEGTSLLPQVSVADGKGASQLSGSGVCGVVWLSGATLRNAPSSISTKGYGVTDTPDHWGGLVIAENSDFINNGRAVEFLKYETTPNKSYFQGCDIFKDNPSLAWAFDRGVSIWECYGIRFSDTHFDGIAGYGIECGNATVTVNSGCSFRDCEDGITADYSLANVYLYENEIRDNLFQRNTRDVTSNSSPNKIYDFKIVNNDFLGATYADLLGTTFRGESAYYIYNNRFSKLTNVNLISTGNRNNNVKCNDFLQGLYTSTIIGSYVYGVQAQYSNAGLLVKGNYFEPSSTSGREFKIYGTSSNKGEIFPSQGNISKSAGNCFSNPINATEAIASSTMFHGYYIYDLYGSPDYCEKPTNNLSDGGTNNYKTYNSTGAFDRGKEGEKSDCFEDGKGEKEGKEEEFLAAKTLVEETLSALEADPEDGNLKESYYSALLQKEDLLKSLLQWAADEGDYAKIEELLLAENTNEALRQVIGMRTRQKNFEGALELLNSMPINGQDDEWYKDIVEINFNMLQTAGRYELTAEEEEKMVAIADAPHSLMRGYACAILHICKGYTCSDDLEPSQSSEGESEERSKNIKELIYAKLFPNPTSGTVNIQYPSLLGEIFRLQVIDMSGRNIKQLEYVNSGSFTLNCGNLPEGVYQIRILNSNQVIGNEKLTIKH